MRTIEHMVIAALASCTLQSVPDFVPGESSLALVSNVETVQDTESTGRPMVASEPGDNESAPTSLKYSAVGAVIGLFVGTLTGYWAAADSESCPLPVPDGRAIDTGCGVDHPHTVDGAILGTALGAVCGFFIALAER